jgi:hypothetical protein
LIIGAQCGVTYFLWTDVFSPESKTRQFNRAVDKIKKDHRCLELLGDANKFKHLEAKQYAYMNICQDPPRGRTARAISIS